MRKVLISLLLLATNAYAGTWTKFAENPSITYDYEPTLITKHDNGGKVLVVWMRGTSHSQVNMTKYELHCGSQSFRILVESRNQNGVDVYQNWEQKDRWKYAIPDSIEMILINTVCPVWQ